MAEKTSSGGMDPKVAALLCWLFTPLSSLIFMLLEDTKSDEFIQFNAKESLYYGILQIILSLGMIVTPIPIIGWLIGCLVGIANLGLTVGRIIVGIKAYNGEKVVLPVLGNMVK
ncbi:DUF4870 domain-containing protein [Candidatus Dojkabacteria bacterium]|nr:DUF4870 domain-containing protein [Candidatus Dojkabacteria bacterium]